MSRRLHHPHGEEAPKARLEPGARWLRLFKSLLLPVSRRILTNHRIKRNVWGTIREAALPYADFAQFAYYPALLSGFGEHHGYRHLDVEDKDRLLPIFELSQKSNSPNLDAATIDIRTSSNGRLFLLDLCKDPAPPPYIPRDSEGEEERIAREAEVQRSYNACLARLLNPTDGFENWRQKVAEFPNALPIIQFSDPVSERLSILRQASLLSGLTDSMGIRVGANTPAAIYELIAQIISILRSPDLLLIIFDCGQSRIHLRARSQFAANGIDQILTRLDLVSRPIVRAVCMSNSFTHSDHEDLRDYENLDWRLWRLARESFPFLFGDYGAIYRLRRPNTFVPPDWKASVVLPLDASWLYYRHPNINDQQGWVDGSQIILRHERAQPLPSAWGSEVILRGSRGDVAQLSSAKHWHAAKVNIHLHRQLNYVPRVFEEYEDAA